MEIDNKKLREIYLEINRLLGEKICCIYNIQGTACYKNCPYGNLCDFITQISDYLVDKGYLSEEEL